MTIKTTAKDSDDAAARVAKSAEQLTATTQQLSDMSKKDLATLAQALAKSKLDVEKLERLMKLACKANAIKQSNTSSICYQGYHY